MDHKKRILYWNPGETAFIYADQVTGFGIVKPLVPLPPGIPLPPDIATFGTIYAMTGGTQFVLAYLPNGGELEDVGYEKFLKGYRNRHAVLMNAQDADMAEQEQAD